MTMATPGAVLAIQSSEGKATGDATFNNTAGPIVADPFTHNVYAVYSAGEPGLQKGD